MIETAQKELLRAFGSEDHSKFKVSIYTPNFPLAQQLRRLRLNQLNTIAAKASSIDVLIKGLVDSVEKTRTERSYTLKTERWPIATDTQLSYLWETLIDRQEDGIQLNSSYIAASALSAWRNLKRQCVDMDELRQMELGQLVKFSQWCEEFEALLRQKRLTTLEQEIEFLLSLPSSQSIAPSESLISPGKQGQLYLYGFIDKPPKLWVDWLEHQFQKVDYIDYATAYDQNDNRTNYLHTSQSSEEELKAALNWAKALGQTDPNARIAIIDVHLKDNIKKTKRLSSTFLDSSIQTSFAQETPLAKTGLFQTALALLAQNQKQLPLAVARQIIHSQCWGDYQSEYDSRLRWDRMLCDKTSSTITTADFRALIEASITEDKSTEIAHQEQTKPTSIATKLTQAFVQEGQISGGKLTPLKWANLFQKQLSIVELGNRLESVQTQQWQSWIDALGEFATLGTVTGKIHIDEALRLLRNSCTRNSAQLSAPKAGITFLDTIEAVADYSHIWLMGVDNATWPAAPSPNPLLPVPLQIKYDMPRASVESEASIAKRLIERLKVAAKETVFSYCAVDTDGDTELRPSPMLGELQALNIVEEASPLNSTVQSDRFEWVDCANAPEVPLQNRTVSGGASLLKTMISSPFDAFSYWRLGAYELGKPQVGLSAADRGNLVHYVLEQVWDEIADSVNLSKISEQAVLEQCTHAASKQLRRYQHRREWLNQAYVELETKRIGKLVASWVEFERTRTAFKKVQSEERLKANIGGLSFDMRLDRLDQLENGELILVDYKTGAGLSRNSLLPLQLPNSPIQPPTEPQLPLYAINVETPPDAICFAQIRTEKQQFIGIGAETYIQGIDALENWNELLQQWRQSLEDLAKAYIQGDCRAVETNPGFGRTDPLAPLHRFAEYEQIEMAKPAWKNAEDPQPSAGASENPQINDQKTTDPQLGLPL